MEKKIKKVMGKEELSGSIEIVFLEAVLMPNGEIIRNGKTVEWLKVNHQTNTPEETIFKEVK